MKTLSKQEIRKYVLSQIGDITALGSKTFPKRVQKKIIRLCTPIFREHYRVIERYANIVTYVIDVNMPFDEDYVNEINKKQDEILKLRKFRETFRRGSH